MMVFITKYALTVGIEEMDVDLCEKYPGMVKTTNSQFFHGEGKEWHRTLAGAIDRADEIRVAKIASLKKSIVKMEKLDFTKVKP